MVESLTSLIRRSGLTTGHSTTSLCPTNRRSFDRFGDDLAEVLLSYLSFEDRFRYESVAKQWQRLVYRSVGELVIDKQFTQYRISWYRFAVMLRKCQYISRIVLLDGDNFQEGMFAEICRHCDHLRSLWVRMKRTYSHYVLPIRGQTMNKFFEKFGHQLDRLSITFTGSPAVESVLDSCVRQQCLPQIRSLDINCTNNKRKYRSLGFYMTVSKDTNGDLLLPVLSFKRLTAFDIIYGNEDRALFDLFVDTFGRSVRSLTITIEATCTEASTVSMMAAIGRLRALVSLKLVYNNNILMSIYAPDFNDRSICRSIVHNLAAVGTNCPLLRSLTLDLYCNCDQLFRETFRTLVATFTQLNRLDVQFGTGISALTSRSLRPMKRLSSVTVDVYYGNVITDGFFAGIDRNLPKLEYFSANRVDIGDKSLTALSRGRYFRDIQCHNVGHELSQEALTKFRASYPISMFRKWLYPLP